MQALDRAAYVLPRHTRRDPRDLGTRLGIEQARQARKTGNSSLAPAFGAEPTPHYSSHHVSCAPGSVASASSNRAAAERG
jgi:hypothetical protein